MATIDDLVNKLKVKAQLVSGQPELKTFTDLELANIIQGAITEHNPTLTLATMTQAEELPVLLLAMIEMCYIRAAAHGSDDPMKSPGNIPGQYQNSANSPFANWMKLASQLYARYTALCARLGSTSGGLGTDGVVVQSVSYKRSDLFNTLWTSANTPYAPPADLTASYSTSDSGVDLEWTAEWSDVFVRFVVFYSLNPGVYRPTNPRGAMGIPNVSPSATQAYQTRTQDEKGCVIGGLNPGTYYFVVVTVGENRKFSFSNEVTVVVPSAPMLRRLRQLTRRPFKLRRGLAKV